MAVSRFVFKMEEIETFAAFKRDEPPFTPYERVKTCVLTTFVLPVRVFAVFTLAGACYLISRISTYGLDMRLYRTRPLPRWRRQLAHMTNWLAGRGASMCAGLSICHTIVKPAEIITPSPLESGEEAVLVREEAVLVCNHVSYLDVIVLMALYQPSFMARYGVIEVPFVGWIAQAIQCLFLDSVGTRGPGLTTTLSERITRSKGLPPLVVFPEGTTTNGKYMVSFRAGAFRAGFPVRPVVIHYPYTHFSPAWEAVHTPYHMWRLLTQFTTYVHVTELPLYVPSEEERRDPYLYARNVQKVMAAALGQPVADHLSRPHKLLYHQLLRGQVGPEQAEEEARHLSSDDYARRKRGVSS